MHKLLFILAMLLVIIFLPAQENIALSLKVEGKVELHRGDATSKTKTGDTYQNKDQLESSNNAYAAIKFIDGSSIVKLFPNSVLTIQAEMENKKMNKKSYLQVGNLWSKVIRKTGTFEIETPTTVVSVKGTDFLLEVDDKGVTKLYTFQGQVKITNKKDGKSAIVKAGQKAISDGSKLEISEADINEINPEIMHEIEGTVKSLNIELQNQEGERREVEIQFE